jgi:enoyl-CoA hydratase/carnithine racemase
MECETITFDVADHVATITLDRPEAMNSFDGRMAAEIGWAWETVRDTDDIHAVVLRANGDRAFCTGMDIRSDPSWFMKSNPWNAFDPGEILSPKQHHRVWKPVVCAVHGLCAGGAQYFLNEADIIICSDDAEFFDPHANGGMVSALEPIGMLARGVPAGDVLRWALMGTEERITPETALRIGLVTEVVPRAELHDRANDIAARIAERDPAAIQGTVRAIWESMDLSRTAALDRGLTYAQIGNVGGADTVPRRNETPRYR